jgi:hypothetical protein
MINLEDYFEKGYVVTTIPQDIMPLLWMEVYGTDWVPDNPNMYNTYKSIPSWYTLTKGNVQEDSVLDRLLCKETTSRAPATLLDVANKIINLPCFNTLQAFKTTAELTYLHLWNGAESIPWHMDTVDSSDTLVLVYLTEETVWNEEWGGCLGLRKELATGNLYETKVLPNNGTMVIVNNANPLIKHKVWALENSAVNRYTFSMSYTWR